MLNEVLIFTVVNIMNVTKSYKIYTKSYKNIHFSNSVLSSSKPRGILVAQRRGRYSKLIRLPCTFTYAVHLGTNWAQSANFASSERIDPKKSASCATSPLKYVYSLDTHTHIIIQIFRENRHLQAPSTLRHQSSSLISWYQYKYIEMPFTTTWYSRTTQKQTFIVKVIFNYLSKFKVQKSCTTSRKIRLKQYFESTWSFVFP